MGILRRLTLIETDDLEDDLITGDKLAHVSKRGLFPRLTLRGAAQPNAVVVGNYSGFEFKVNDVLYSSFHNVMDRITDGDIGVHLVWLCGETYATNSGEIRWEVTWSATCEDVCEDATSPTHSGTLDSGDLDIPASANYLDQTSLIIPGAGIEAHDIVGLVIKRIGLVGGNNPTTDPTLVDIHLFYVSDKRGEVI